MPWANALYVGFLRCVRRCEGRRKEEERERESKEGDDDETRRSIDSTDSSVAERKGGTDSGSGKRGEDE